MAVQRTTDSKAGSDKKVATKAARDVDTDGTFDPGIGSSMGNPYVMAAKVGLNLYISQMEKKAKLQSAIADAKLQRAEADINRVRMTDAFQKNMERVNEINMDNTFNIEIAKQEAESGITAGFAGSGLSGSSINDINAEVYRSVANQHNQNYKQTKQQVGDLKYDFETNMTDLNRSTSQIGASDEMDPGMEWASIISKSL